MAPVQMAQIKPVFVISVSHAKSRDAPVSRTLSLPFRVLSHPYKTENKVFSDLNCGKILLMNNAILVIT